MVWVNGVEQKVQLAYNSRGNRGGGAGSGGGTGKAAQCFLGVYVDASHWSAGSKSLSVRLPPLNATSKYLGAFWYGTKDAYTSDVAGPLPAGNLTQCAHDENLITAAPAGSKSVLYLVIDDLRPQLGTYGNPETHSPNLDAFAKTATVFDNAYTQIA